jgi:hypothetical protein
MESAGGLDLYSIIDLMWLLQMTEYKLLRILNSCFGKKKIVVPNINVTRMYPSQQNNCTQNLRTHDGTIGIFCET